MSYFDDSFTPNNVENRYTSIELEYRQYQPKLMKDLANKIVNKVHNARPNEILCIYLDMRLSETSINTIMNELKDKGWDPRLSYNSIHV